MHAYAVGGAARYGLPFQTNSTELPVGTETGAYILRGRNVQFESGREACMQTSQGAPVATCRPPKD